MKRFLLLFAALLLTGCNIEPKADEWFVMTPETLQNRQLESRRYNGLNNEEILSASAAVLQDMGFMLNESETRLGVLTASKDRDAQQAGEIVAAAVVAAFLGTRVPTALTQKIIVSLVVKPVLDDQGEVVEKSHIVRITFKQIVTMSDRSTQVNILRDPEIYQGFYSKLSKSVFIEGQKI